MTKPLIVLNCLLTLPFGLAALAVPEPLFARFAVALDPAGALVARGYAATLIGYGLLLWGLRDAVEPRLTRYLLVSIIAFNAIEALIQGMAAAQGVAGGPIAMNAGLHAVVAAWSVLLLLKQRPTAAHG